MSEIDPFILGWSIGVLTFFVVYWLFIKKKEVGKDG